ncbi:MAG: S-layer protein, partial [archaeon]
TEATTANFFARDTAVSTTTPSTRDYYTRWGTYVDSIGSTLLSLRAPMEQSFGEYVVGTQAELSGTPISAEAGETVAVGSVNVKVEGSVGGVTKATLPSTVAKLDSDVTSADKTGYNLVLVGGPAVNTLVNALQTEGKLTKTIGSVGSTADIAAAGAGVVELVADAFATGKYAVVVAGSDRAGTAKAAGVLAAFDSNMAKLDGKTVYEV